MVWAIVIIGTLLVVAWTIWQSKRSTALEKFEF
jgi:predicted negative regulator of RcsB-dependent stress response